MMHDITATEPKMVTQKLEYDNEFGGLVATDNYTEVKDMDTAQERKSYACRCGEEFNSIQEAESHIEEEA